MKIKNLKINAFGNLENKEIELVEGINVIQGKNEAGKSTILKFISSMLYGITKNKNGKIVSDFERYKPWKTEEYSGKLTYELDNKQFFEIFRDFQKKAPKLYNEKSEEVTSQYIVDKGKGSEFFYEQTGITEEILMKTAIIEQQQVKLNQMEQNTILQKMTNLVSTGDDKISYKKAVEKLNKKQLEEIGTERSTGRPINLIKEKIQKYEMELDEVKRCQKQKEEIKEQQKEIERKIKYQKNIIDIAQKVEELRGQESIEQEKVNLLKNMLYEVEEKIEENKKEPVSYLEAKKISNFSLILNILLLVITIAQFIWLKNITVAVIFMIITVAFGMWIGVKKVNSDKQIRMENARRREENKRNERELQILEEDRKQKEEELKKIEQENKNKQEIGKIEFQKQYDNVEYKDILQNWLKIEKEDLKKQIKEVESYYQQLKIEENTLKIKEQYNAEKLEELANIQENLMQLKEEKNELEKNNTCILLVKEALEKAYEKMKENISPEFVNRLSNCVQNISGGQYHTVKWNDQQGLVVELDNGDYINCERLSIGTVEQMYFSLRLSVLKEICEEKVPIILDEPFVYYDQQRLENILQYLAQEWKQYQIIIFSCTDREIKALEKLHVPHKNINLY